MKCANHPDRSALGYCAHCGKPVCRACLVRLPTGTYCEACASSEDRPVRRARVFPWWAIALAVLGASILLRLLLH
jgi:hypothetical protein